MTGERVRAIEAKLIEAFSPLELLVKDQSHLHAGHEGAKGGGGHFHVTIVSKAFEGCTGLERHRMVFSALDSMMESDIHALRIDANVPDITRAP
jgi:BolA protein